MPHSIFLGSALATQDRADMSPVLDEPEDTKTCISMSSETVEGCSEDLAGPADSPALRIIVPAGPRLTRQSFWKAFRGHSVRNVAEPRHHSERENNSLAFVNAHLRHGIVNLAISLLGLAVVINSLYAPTRSPCSSRTTLTMSFTQHPNPRGSSLQRQLSSHRQPFRRCRTHQKFCWSR
jgi:metal iron transporter